MWEAVASAPGGLVVPEPSSAFPQGCRLWGGEGGCLWLQPQGQKWLFLGPQTLSTPLGSVLPSTGLDRSQLSERLVLAAASGGCSVRGIRGTPRPEIPLFFKVVHILVDHPLLLFSNFSYSVFPLKLSVWFLSLDRCTFPPLHVTRLSSWSLRLPCPSLVVRRLIMICFGRGVCVLLGFLGVS